LGWVLFAFLFEDLQDGQLQNIANLFNSLEVDLLLEVLQGLLRVAFMEQ
jgi:hypothetical protein